ncbi:MAG: arginine repressor [Lachnospiraceae bacterium]|jgi:transcriptional regulator of arginine metabolism
MKRKRHEKIIELIGKYDIETQEELADLLVSEGFQVTQATVSRDIRELKLFKVPGKEGRQKYVLLDRQQHQMAKRYVGILREAFVSMDRAQNILVIKTVSGMAMAVGAALDSIGWKEIVGCIAGDDTVMCAIRTAEDTETVMEELDKILRNSRDSI